MITLAETEIRPEGFESGVAAAPASPAGPVDSGQFIRMPPGNGLPGWAQTIRFGTRPRAFNLSAHRRFGDVWQMQVLARKQPFVVTCHPTTCAR
ncbi:MAG: hypothetical protein ACR2MK_06860 [Solirubrobacteraceae bacterium]